MDTDRRPEPTGENTMKWLLKTLGGAVIAGLGWKLGADAYEALKKELKKRTEKEAKAKADDRDKDVENGAGATQTEVVDVPKPAVYGGR
jgi:hypothetical protein